LKKQVDDAAKVFAESKLKFGIEEKDKHVGRKVIEKAIQDMAIQPIKHMKFGVVSGRIMVGKTESIVAALKGRKGVIKVKLSEVGVISEYTIKEKICEEVKLVDKSQFKALIEATYKILGIIPIVVIEIEKGATDPSNMKCSENFAKGCCWDNDAKCMVYIVPSDNASTDLLVPEQKPRRELIWVGPLSKEDGKKLLGKYADFKMGDTGLEAVDAAFKDRKDGGEERGYEELFKIVGLHPSDLKG